MIAKPVAQLMTLEHVKEHDNREDLWLAVHGKVYDLTLFAPDHPGGVDILVECAGTDASEPFDYAGHSDDAIRTISRYQIGILEQDAKPRTQSTAIPKDEQTARTAPFTSMSFFEQAQNRLSKLMMTGHGQKLLIALAFGTLLGFAGLIFVTVTSNNTFIRSIGDDSMTTSTAFTSGVLLALTAAGCGVGYGYKQLSKTLDHEADVFAYPAVKPWPSAKPLTPELRKRI